jgi:hypothetical protein
MDGVISLAHCLPRIATSKTLTLRGWLWPKPNVPATAYVAEPMKKRRQSMLRMARSFNHIAERTERA